MITFVHQYAYFFSLVLFIFPVSVAFDGMSGFKVAKKLMTLKGLIYLILSVAFWSTYDIFWIGELGHFPTNRVLFTIGGIPMEEMILFSISFYNIGAIFTWSKVNFT